MTVRRAEGQPYPKQSKGQSERGRNPADPRRLDSLTSLRFFAAVLVVLLHMQILGVVAGERYLARIGYTGVGFFFVLSGFVLTWSHRKGDSARAFYRRRFARVYPLHFVTLLIGIVVTRLVAAWPHSAQIFTSLSLTQAWLPVGRFIQGPNPPSWSLSAEAFFYASFPVLIVLAVRLPSRRRLPVGAGMVVAAFAVLVLAQYSDPRVATGFGAFPPYLLVWFALGILLALAVRDGFRIRVRVSHAVLLVALSLTIATLANFRYGAYGQLIMLPAWMMLILAAATQDLRGSPSWLRTTWVRRLGEWSFALYLTHQLMIRTLRHLYPSLVSGRGVAGGLAVEFVLLVTLVAISAAAYYGIERPCEHRLRHAQPRAEEIGLAS